MDGFVLCCVLVELTVGLRVGWVGGSLCNNGLTRLDQSRKLISSL